MNRTTKQWICVLGWRKLALCWLKSAVERGKTSWTTIQNGEKAISLLSIHQAHAGKENITPKWKRFTNYKTNGLMLGDEIRHTFVMGNDFYTLISSVAKNILPAHICEPSGQYLWLKCEEERWKKLAIAQHQINNFYFFVVLFQQQVQRVAWDAMTWPISNAPRPRQSECDNETVASNKTYRKVCVVGLDCSKGKSFVENCDYFPRQRRYILVHAFTPSLAQRHRFGSIRFLLFYDAVCSATTSSRWHCCWLSSAATVTSVNCIAFVQKQITQCAEIIPPRKLAAVNLANGF